MSVLIAYGSQTGNAEEIAKQLFEQSKQYQFAKFSCVPQKNIRTIQALEPYSIIVFITSTTGDGDPPDASLPFFRALRRHQSENKKCSFRYCLLGLGDSNYSKFCRSTKDLDLILQSLGATRVCDTVLADDATGMEDTVSKWSAGIFPILQSALTKSSSSSASADSTPSSSTPPPPQCIVMYGSQTGNATEIAKTVAESMRSKVRCQLSVMSDIDLSTELSNWGQHNRYPLLVFVTSTTGDGDPPDNARKFLRGLKMIPIDNNPLMHIKYAVLGLGDSNYSKFNRPAKDLDAMLASRGARSFLPLTLADDATGLEQVVDPWIESVLPAVQLQLKAIESNPIPTTCQSAEVQAVPATPSISTTSTPTPVPSKIDMSVIKKPFRPAALRACASKLNWLTTAVDSTNAIHSKTAKGVSTELWWRWSRLESAANAANTTEAVEHSLRGCTHDTPFLAGISGAKMLTGEGSEKHVLHLELSLPQATTSKNSFVSSVNQSIGALHYAPGDAIGIHCPNDPHVVTVLLQRLQVVEQADSLCAVSDSQLPASFTPRQALTYIVDIHVQMYKKAFLRALAEHCSDANEKEMLSFLSSREGADLYNSEITKLSLLQLLCKFPSCQPPLAFILSELPALQPRYYSASSAPSRHPSHVHVAMSLVQHTTADGQPGRGLCTGWLRDISLGTTNNQQLPLIGCVADENRVYVPAFLRRSRDFRVPEDVKRPLIMIGPGTGVSPFRGFLQHRAAQLKSLKSDGGSSMGSWRGMDLALDESETDSSNASAAQSFGSALLFFGARTRQHDFLYASDWSEFLTAGALTDLFTAFSRDESTGQDKVYVQTRMREHGQRLCALLTDSACPAHVFVCGDGAVMEKDTQAALIDILQQHAGMSLDEAKAFFVKMLADKRYVADVWS